MSSSEDKCEVSEDKHEDRGKIEYFRETINSAQGKKGKSKPPLGECIRMSKLEAQRDAIFLLIAKTYSIQAIFFFLLSSCASTRFSSLRFLKLGISPTALVAEGSYLVVTIKHRFRIISFLHSFRFLIFIFRPYFRVLITWGVFQQIFGTSGKFRVSYLS